MDEHAPDGWYEKLVYRLKSPQTPPSWTSGETLALLVAFLITTLIIGTTIASFVFNGQVTPVSLLFGWTAGHLIMIGYIMVTRRQQKRLSELNLRQEIALPLPYVLMTGVAAALTIDVIIAILAGFHITPALDCFGGDFNRPSIWLEWLLAAVFLIVVQPVTEGLVFMGVILPRLRVFPGARSGILATAVLFAIFHAIVYGTTLTGSDVFWYGFITPLLIGLFLSAVRVYTGSTRAAIIASVGVGMVLLFGSLVLVSGTTGGCEFIVQALTI